MRDVTGGFKPIHRRIEPRGYPQSPADPNVRAVVRSERPSFCQSLSGGEGKAQRVKGASGWYGSVRGTNVETSRSSRYKKQRERCGYHSYRLWRSAALHQKPLAHGAFLPCRALRRLDDIAGFDAVGAHHHSFGHSVAKGPYPLKVGVESPLVHIVRMTDMVACHGLFTADFTHL